MRHGKLVAWFLGLVVVIVGSVNAGFYGMYRSEIKEMDARLRTVETRQSIVITKLDIMIDTQRRIEQKFDEHISKGAITLKP